MLFENEFSPSFLMLHLVVLLFAFFLVLLPLISSAECQAMSIDDLLNPEFPNYDDKIEESLPIVQEPNNEGNIDQLLGPKDMFPFLPDNHRDSGTGKFNSFWLSMIIWAKDQILYNEAGSIGHKQNLDG